MRAFIAVELPSPFWEETAGLARQLGNHIEARFLDPETYHLTLAFLGEVDEAGKGRGMDALDAACTQVGGLPLASDGLGTFGRKHDAQLWLGVRACGPLMQLAANLRAELDARALAYDPKPFRPHITLARRARIPKGTLPPLPFPLPAVACKVSLFKSELSRTGATYKALYTVNLPAALSGR